MKKGISFIFQIRSVKPNEISAVVGGFADAEALVCLKDLLNSLDSEGLCTEEMFITDGAGYVFVDASEFSQSVNQVCDN